MSRVVVFLSAFFSLTVFANTSIDSIHQFTIDSSILAKKVSITLSLPDEYDNNTARYPVLYYLDADQNVKHILGSLDVLNRTGKVPPIITVGIQSDNRDADYKPTLETNNNTSTSPDSNFHRFITDELMPMIDKRYKTNHFNMLEGHSLGGLFASYSMLNHADVFDAYIIISPALWWNNNWAMSEATQRFANRARINKRVFFAIGDEDGDGMKRELQQFFEALPKQDKNDALIKHLELAGEGHMSAPLLGNYFGLIHIFSDMHYPKAKWDPFVVEDFVRHERLITTKYGGAAKQNEETYAYLVNRLLVNQDYESASIIAQFLTKHYPQNHYNFQALAQAYLLNGQNEKSLNAFSQALNLSTVKPSGSFKPDIYQHNINLIKHPLNAEKLNRFVGNYKTPNLTITIRKHGHQLKGFAQGLGDFDLFPEAPNRYQLRITATVIEFVSDSSGTITHLNIHQGNIIKAEKLVN